MIKLVGIPAREGLRHIHMSLVVCQRVMIAMALASPAIAAYLRRLLWL